MVNKRLTDDQDFLGSDVPVDRFSGGLEKPCYRHENLRSLHSSAGRAVEQVLAAAQVDEVADESGAAAMQAVEVAGRVPENGKLLSMLNFIKLRRGEAIEDHPVGVTVVDESLLFTLPTAEGTPLSIKLQKGGHDHSPHLSIEVGEESEVHNRNSLKEANLDSDVQLAAIVHFCKELSKTLVKFETFVPELVAQVDIIASKGFEKDSSLDLEDPRWVELEEMLKAFQILRLLMEGDVNYSMISHMINSPMRSIVGSDGYLCYPESLDDFDTGLDMIRTSIAKLKVILGNYLPRMAEEGLKFGSFSILEVAEDVKRYFSGKSSNITVDFDGDYCDTLVSKWVLEALLENLYNNAFKAGAENIRIEILKQEDLILVRVHDDCEEAIPENVLATLFKSVQAKGIGDGAGCNVAGQFLADQQSMIKPSTGHDHADKLREDFGIPDDVTPFYQISMHQRLGPDGRPTEKYVEMTFPLVTRMPFNAASATEAKAA